MVGRVCAGEDDVNEDDTEGHENDGARALDSTGAVIPAGYDAVVPCHKLPALTLRRLSNS